MSLEPLQVLKFQGGTVDILFMIKILKQLFLAV